MTPVEVVTALIRDDQGRLLVVRKRGTERFMLPGGKAEAGEAAADTLARELSEELGLALVQARSFGVFEADAANEPGRRVIGHVHHALTTGAPAPAAEITEMRWIALAPPYPVALAPLLETQILPALIAVSPSSG
ncbi:NUDIX domain-containing protein [Phenylobacterium sp.]|uniref:NUDIX hydrolase n=1 Tax=Phenylobacterium sp. TaxID=1871053 RepID=UPI0035B2D94D